MSDESPTDSPRDILPEPAPAPKKKPRGGPSTHRPGCQCNYHRRYPNTLDGAQEAGFGPDGIIPDPGQETALTVRPPSNAMYADRPPMTTFGKTGRDRIAQWIEMRALEPDITNKEVARRLGIAPKSLNTLISQATREKWLVIDDPLSRIEHEIIPKTIENLDYFLKKKDRSVTIEVAKGTIFKQFAESHGIIEAPTTVLALKIESPHRQGEPPPDVKIITGTIVGKPKGFSDISEND